MHITWTQKAWHTNKKTGHKVCWRWEGQRSDGRTFLILWFPHIGYIASTFNGTKLGEGKSLAEAQEFCKSAINPVVNLGKVSRPASGDYASIKTG